MEIISLKQPSTKNRVGTAQGAHIVAVFVIVQLRQGFEDRRTCPVGGAEVGLSQTLSKPLDHGMVSMFFVDFLVMSTGQGLRFLQKTPKNITRTAEKMGHPKRKNSSSNQSIFRGQGGGNQILSNKTNKIGREFFQPAPNGPVHSL